MRRLVALVAIGVTLAVGFPHAGFAAIPPPTVEGLPADLRVNQIQVIGTHNSFHLRPKEPLLSVERFVDPAGTEQLEYDHTPLDVQLGTERVRQLELDVFADSAGGRWAEPRGGLINGMDFSSRPEMYEPGFKVLHIQDIDYETTCTTLVACLTTVKAWSDANPGHLPVMILIELKSDPVPDPSGGFVFTQPEPVDTAQLDALDAELRSVFSEDEILTPDDVRGGHATLEDAILTDGWPTIGDTQGQVMFALDNGGSVADLYRTGHPTLEGRVMFTDGAPGDAWAAFMKRNDPNGANQTEITGLVEDGYVVRTRADEPTFQARSGDTAQRDAALASGAQWVSTDYPVPGMADEFGTDYVAELPGTGNGRCNPVNGVELCRTEVQLHRVDRQVRPGETITVVLDVRNSGDVPLTGVTVEAPGMTCQSVLPIPVGGQPNPACSRIATNDDVREFRAQATVDANEAAPRTTNEVVTYVFPDHAFPDVPDGAFFDRALDWFRYHELVTGFADGTFRSRDPVTRGQVVNMLWHLVDTPSGSPAHGFPDVRPGVFYEDALDWAKATGLVTGFPDGTYRPTTPVTRGQVASMLWQLFGEPAGSPPHGFPDVAPGSPHDAAIAWIKAQGLMTGFPDGTFRAGDPTTRGQAARLLWFVAQDEDIWTTFPGPQPSTTLLPCC